MKERTHKSGMTKQEAQSKRPRRSRLRGALLPSTLLALMVGAHVLGITLLNIESAKRERLAKQITQLRIENEQLQTRLNLRVDETDLRRWAESAGMVRIDTVATPTAVSLPAPIEPTRRQTAQFTAR